MQRVKFDLYYQIKFISIDFVQQITLGTFKCALSYIVAHTFDIRTFIHSSFDNWYNKNSGSTAVL